MSKEAQAYEEAELELANNEGEVSQTSDIEEPAQDENEPLKLRSQIARLEQALAQEREIRLRECAEFENIKKRIERQASSDLEYANSKIIKDLLPLLDALDQAAKYENASEDEKSGLQNIIKLFEKVLQDHGVSKISANLGDAINPEVHEVLLNQSNPELEPGSISMIMQVGYKLKDRVLRAAKVAANN